jgi:hypothetical protein
MNETAGSRSGAYVTAAAAALLAASAGTLAFMLGGPGALGYVALFVLAAAPGWPVGWALFGRRHAAGWVAGSLIGYVLSAWGLWAAARLGGDSASDFAAAWVVLCAAAGPLVRVRKPLVTLPEWTRRDTAALLLVLLLVPAILSLPFRNLGVADAHGNRYYRAYFTADFLWHMALTDQLREFELPPANPYAADLTLNYYWTYFLVPAAVVDSGLLPDLGVDAALKANALCAGLLFVAAIFLAAWRMAPRAFAAFTGVALTLLAASAEGAYVLWDLHSRNVGVAAVRELNIDAITMWILGGLTIDGLPRSLWYTPQHAMACACGLIALLVAGAGRVSLGAAALAGVAIAGAVTLSPFLGGAFALIYGLSAVIVAVRCRNPLVASIARHAVAAAPTLLAVAWTVHNQMLEGAGGALVFGLTGHAAVNPVSALLLTLGPVLVPAALGLWWVRRLPPAAIPAVTALGVGLGLYYLVSIGKTDPLWVGWRAGQILLVMLPGFVAVFVAANSASLTRRIACGALVLLALFVGLPTTVIDAYNAQDVRNSAMGPGFPWTISTDPAQQAAFDWIRTETPEDAVVQMEPTVRGRATWTLIPSFAGRRMAAGLPISLVNRPYYQTRSQSVRELYGTAEGPRAWSIARRLGIDYIYIDQVERRAYPAAALQKFELDTAHFEPVYRADHVAIYKVRDGAADEAPS